MAEWDAALFFWLNDFAGRWQWLDEWWRFWANDYIVPSLLVGALALGWFTGARRGRAALLAALVALALANLLVALSNALWFRPRPFTYHDVTLLFYYPSDSSFPSNAAAVVWALGWTLARCYPRARPVLILPLLMGLARIWVGVHYPLDIVGGAALGIVAAEAARRLPLEQFSGGLVRLARLLKLG